MSHDAAVLSADRSQRTNRAVQPWTTLVLSSNSRDPLIVGRYLTYASRTTLLPA